VAKFDRDPALAGQCGVELNPLALRNTNGIMLNQVEVGLVVQMEHVILVTIPTLYPYLREIIFLPRGHPKLYPASHVNESHSCGIQGVQGYVHKPVCVRHGEKFMSVWRSATIIAVVRCRSVADHSEHCAIICQA
jgi:hypothetical protein